MHVNTKYGVVILAAGSSSRMGKPKQLLGYKHSTLLLHAVDQSLPLPDAAIIVVTGASHKLVEEQLAGKHVTIRYNAEWENGMGSSIRTGVMALISIHTFLEAILIIVCDQPFLTTAILSGLVDGYRSTGRGIVASAYQDTIGTPVLFAAKYFDGLMHLEGEEGAKKIIHKNMDDMATRPFPLGGIDIDTQEDYLKLMDQ